MTCPPEVIQWFDRNLLQNSEPLGDSLKKLRRLYNDAVTRFTHKNMSPEKRKRMEIQKQIIGDYLEWIETSQENSKGKTRNKTQRPMYSIRCPYRSNQRIFERLKYRRPLVAK